MNCENCDYKKHHIGDGWCYMFRDKVSENCGQFKSNLNVAFKFPNNAKNWGELLARFKSI